MKEVIEFGGFVLAHCAAIAAGNEPGDLICPFAVITKGENRQAIDFESETQEEAVAKGWASLDQWRDEIDFWGFGREGLFNDGSEKKVDVLVVSVWTRGMNEAINIFHRFSSTTTGEFFLFGPAEFSIDGQLVGGVERENLMRSLEVGILRHPRGTTWPQWRRQ
jgi:hypothetical protein